jgi:zinc-ribbon domain
MLCRHCGTEIADRALICYRCGAATTDPEFAPPAPARTVPWAVIVLAVLLILLALAAGLFLM